MKTHSSRGSGGSSLPPPPAPTARDANPWPMPEQFGDRPAPAPRLPRRPGPKAPVGEEIGPPGQKVPAAAAPSAARARQVEDRKRVPPVADAKPPTAQVPQRRRRSRGLPLLILFGAIAAAGIAAREAIAAGDYAGAVGPIVIALFVALSVFQRWRQHDRE